MRASLFVVAVLFAAQPAFAQVQVVSESIEKRVTALETRVTRLEQQAGIAAPQPLPAPAGVTPAPTYGPNIHYAGYQFASYGTAQVCDAAGNCGPAMGPGGRVGDGRILNRLRQPFGGRFRR